MNAYRDPDPRNGERVLILDGVEKDESGVEFCVMSIIRDGKPLGFKTKIRADRLKEYPKLTRREIKRIQEGDKGRWKFCPNCGVELK